MPQAEIQTLAPCELHELLASGSFQPCLLLYVALLYFLNLVISNLITLSYTPKYQTTFLHHTHTHSLCFFHTSRSFPMVSPSSSMAPSPPVLTHSDYFSIKCSRTGVSSFMKIKIIQHYVERNTKEHSPHLEYRKCSINGASHYFP